VSTAVQTPTERAFIAANRIGKTEGVGAFETVLLLGRVGAFGTGMIPRDRLVKWRCKPGVPDAIESIQVKHVSGGLSELGFKSYAEGVESFSGTERHWIWLDEECPQSIYAECLMRGMTCDGLVILTFTPLQGLSEVVLQFLPTGRLEEGKQPSEPSML
jgi:phage terminase large subunit-like protein